MLEHTSTTLADCQPGDIWVNCPAATFTERWFGCLVAAVKPTRGESVLVSLTPGVGHSYITRGITAKGTTQVEVLRPIQDGEAS